MTMICKLLLVALVRLSWTIPIDNKVIGQPELECAATSMDIQFSVKNDFSGHVYVKGLYSDPNCRNDRTGSRFAGIHLEFDTCNVNRVRSVNPRGVFMTTTVVITFHPEVLTKVDKAYRFQCFYMEADKTVSNELEVSELTTVLRTENVPMPICRYEILFGGPYGQPIKYALVGEQVYHKWTCDSRTINIFCMTVHSCYVDDGNGDRVDLLNVDGCALDKYLLNNPEYPTDLMAGVEAHVFKYADRSQAFFQCQIEITVKEPNSKCVRPKCPQPDGRGAGRSGVRRKRRSGEIIDVVSELTAMNIDNDARNFILLIQSGLYHMWHHLRGVLKWCHLWCLRHR